ncbi:class I adenylate-forming enzyme family protein [Streptomyces sp. NPDC050418]|uniref:class I adenylate-forming enzyme family protein n=1 Tax=Streptomyces sp. NPDC050418 TaxID=3365612 RepID=UPI0037AD263B
MIKLTDIRKHAAERPDHVAIVAGTTRLTWADLEDKVARAARGLAAELPDTRPARAVFLADNSWELIVAMAACATLGVPCIGLDYTAGPGATAGALAQLQPSVILSTGHHRGLLEEADWPGARTVLHIDLDDSAAQRPARLKPFAELLAHEPGPVEPVVQPFEAFSFTSGTSGIPKMVIRKTSFEARRLADLVDQFSFGPDDTHLVTVPLYHASGPGWARVFLALGGSIVLGRYEDPAELSRIIEAEGVTTTLMVPPVLTRLVSHPGSENLHRTGKLRFVLSGGRHLNRWVINNAWDRLGPVLHLYYGTTESGLNTLITPEELLVAPCRSGHPMAGNTIVIVDAEGRPLPVGTRGRVAIASYQLMDAYANATPTFLHLDLGDGQGEQRFLLTGDSGVMDEQGRLELTGRSDGVAKMDETSPLDVNVFGLESDLMDLPCVRETSVLRVEVPEIGDALIVPFAAVSPERLESGRRAVQAACDRRVPCLPNYVVAVDAIPFSPTGKVRTAQLLDMVLPQVRLVAREQMRELLAV